MNKRKTKKAIKKYVTGRPLCGGELKALSSKYPSLDLSIRPCMHLVRAIDQTKAAFEDIARAYDLPSTQVLGYVVGGLLEQVRASMPTAEEWVRAMLTLGCGDWGMQIPLYRWGS